MDTHKLYANQFPSGTIVNLDIQNFNAETGEFDTKRESYMVTHCALQPHNSFTVYGHRVNADNTLGDIEIIGTNAYLEIKLGSMTHHSVCDSLYHDAVSGGHIVPGTGPFIKEPAPWSYQHFPEGTVFVVKKYLRLFPNKDNSLEVNRTFTAKSIVHNGLDSYCVETTTPNSDIYEANCLIDGYYTVNISHVEKIIKRGDGKVTISSAEFNGRQYSKHSYYKTPLVRKHTQWVGGGKTNYISYDPNTLLIHAFAKLDLDVGTEVNNNLLYREFLRQTFVKWKPLVYAKANRKRTDRWIKQNINRFLMPIQLAKDIDNDERQSTYQWDEDY